MQNPSAVLATTSLLPALLCSLAVSQTDAPELTSIVQQVEKAQPENRPKASYQVIRRYRAFGSNNGKITSEVVAEVDFRPPSSTCCVIQQWTGSRHGENVVRHILANEVEPATKTAGSVAVPHDNCPFVYPGGSAAQGTPAIPTG